VRYLWTVMVISEHHVAEGRTGELTEARSQAEAALTEYIAGLTEAERE
jgi:hypothetical protein